MSTNDVTAEQRRAALALVVAVADTIRECGSVPSGELYAMLMDKLTFIAYTRIIDTLKSAQLVEESAHVLRWIGPALSDTKSS